MWRVDLSNLDASKNESISFRANLKDTFEHAVTDITISTRPEQEGLVIKAEGEVTFGRAPWVCFFIGIAGEFFSRIVAGVGLTFFLIFLIEYLLSKNNPKKYLEDIFNSLEYQSMGEGSTTSYAAMTSSPITVKKPLPVWLAILITLSICCVSMIIYAMTDNMIFPWLILIGTALWAANDSAKIKLDKYKSGISAKPIPLLIGFVLLGGIVFPWYLVVRSRIINGLAELKTQADYEKEKSLY